MNNPASESAYESIIEKRDQFFQLRDDKFRLLEEIAQMSEKINEKNRLKSVIHSTQSNVDFLKSEIDRVKKQITSDKENMGSMKKQMTARHEKVKNDKDKCSKLSNAIKKMEKLKNKKEDPDLSGLNKVQQSIIDFQKLHIHKLNTLIFTLDGIKPNSCEEDNLQKSTFNVLTDARMTMFINGRWIKAKDPIYYEIVKSKLPSNGDYSAYYKDPELDEAKKTLPEQQQLPWLDMNAPRSRNEIQAALTYTTQFVNLIAFILDATLPYNLPHNKWSSQSLNEKQFQNAVAKLNVNIIYLCLHQSIPILNQLPRNTLENLNYFLTYIQKIKYTTSRAKERHSIEYPNEIINSLDEMFVLDETDERGIDSIPNLPFNDNEDWETIPNSDQIPMDSTTNPISPVTSINRRGLIESSTNLLSSFTQFFKHLGSGQGSGSS